MTKHVVDHRRINTSGRLMQFLRIAREARATWHRTEAKPGPARVVQYCRIARGRVV